MFVLKEYYIKYLKDIRGLSDSSAAHYLNAINTISKILVNEGKIKENLVDKIYSERADRLANSGIVLARNEFKKMVL